MSFLKPIQNENRNINILTELKKYDDDTRRTDDTFTLPEKKVVRLEMKNILERVVQDDSFKEKVDNIVENNLDSSSLKNYLTLQKELQMQIQQDMKTYRINTKKEKDVEKILKKEMTAYESEGIRENTCLLFMSIC
ncbi:hypothetical protein AVEN_60264-1 [Araneus ventricosus]|uniref:Uncharacterized protein n=1 Tax=Araneus ventricosus TaxID=182803 RepID=A0A4Y2D0W7_ARAVE|nr:hypothetical protein AVEN_60264-1 [Araneus ventricosus]